MIRAIVSIARAVAAAACGSRTSLDGPLAEQALVDAGVDAPLTPRTCTPDGRRHAVATGLDAPVRMSLDGADVFITSGVEADGHVVRIALSDGALQEIARNQIGPTDVVADRDSVFWLNVGEGAVHSYSRAYGTQRTLDDGLGATPQSLGADVAYLYVGNTNGPFRKIPKSPVERRDVVIVPLVAGTPAIATDDDRVYYIDQSVSTLQSIDKLGGDPRTHGQNVTGPSLAVAGGTVFSVVRDGNGASIASQPPSGGAATTLASSTGTIERFVVDADQVYFAESLAGGVHWNMRAVSRSGGPVIQIADDVGSVADIAVDDECVYWIERGTNASLVRAPKRVPMH